MQRSGKAVTAAVPKEELGRIYSTVVAENKANQAAAAEIANREDITKGVETYDRGFAEAGQAAAAQAAQEQRELEGMYSPQSTVDPDYGIGGREGAQEALAEANKEAMGIGYDTFEEEESGGGGGSGDDDGTYICTAAFKSGVSPADRFRANRKYGIKLRRNDPLLMRGYDRVGPWLATKVGHTKVGNVLTQLYAKKANNEKLNLKYKLLDSILNLTTRPALRLLGRFA